MKFQKKKENSILGYLRLLGQKGEKRGKRGKQSPVRRLTLLRHLS